MRLFKAKVNESIFNFTLLSLLTLDNKVFIIIIITISQRTRKYRKDTKAWLKPTARSLQMENLMTVPKEFWLIYRLKITVNQRNSVSRKQDQKDIHVLSSTESDSFNSAPLPTNP